MISALPDIKKITLTSKDEFMIIACDGIWNSLTSEAVVEFIKDKLKSGTEKMSEICEKVCLFTKLINLHIVFYLIFFFCYIQLFDTCLAPDTYGDGTGCDNMTAVIVKFKTNKELSDGNIEIADVGTSIKRAGEKIDDTENPIKRIKTDTGTSSSNADEIKTS